MKGAIETREVITVDAGGICLRGTYHKPPGEKSDSSRHTDEKNHIGILFLGPGVLPRAASGDSAVYWADSLAKCGYLAFRFDLPGLGDSDGDLLTQAIDVDAGDYGPVLSAMANYVAQRFNLSGVVVVGHCSGAVTALYAAAANERIKGLILLDPYFHVQPGSGPQSMLLHLHVQIVKALAWDRIARPILRDVAVKLPSRIRSIYHRVNLIRNRLLVRRKRLPRNANLSLIRCWNQLAAKHIRMLVLRSPSSTPRSGEFDYIDFLRPLSDTDCCMTVKLIERAGAVACTRAFAERHGKEAVRTNTEQWLSAYFPLTRCTETGDTGRHPPELADCMLGVVTNVR